MSPVLLHPEPLAASNQVDTKSQRIVHSRITRRRSMIGIVLHIQTNQSLGKTKDSSQQEGGGLSDPEIQTSKVESDVTGGAKEITSCTKFLAPFDYFEYFLFELSFKGGVKLVTAVC